MVQNKFIHFPLVPYNSSVDRVSTFCQWENRDWMIKWALEMLLYSGNCFLLGIIEYWVLVFNTPVRMFLSHVRVAFITFAVLYSHHLCWVPWHFHLCRGNPTPMKQLSSIVPCSSHHEFMFQLWICLCWTVRIRGVLADVLSCGCLLPVSVFLRFIHIIMYSSTSAFLMAE